MGFFGLGKKEKPQTRINWVRLQTEQDLDQLIKKESFEKPVVLYKHSTRCSISAMALNRLETDWDIDPESAVPVYLDLIAFRAVSNKIAADLAVRHESPQILLVKAGQCVYTASHTDIDADELKSNL